MNILRIIIFFGSLLFGIFLLINLSIPGTWTFTEKQKIAQKPDIIRFEWNQFPPSVHQNAWNAFEKKVAWKPASQAPESRAFAWSADGFLGVTEIRNQEFEWIFSEPYGVKGKGIYEVRSEGDSSEISLQFEMKVPFFFRIWQLFLPAKFKPVLSEQLQLLAAHCAKVETLPDAKDLKWRWLTLKGMRADSIALPYDEWQLKVWTDLDRIKQVESTVLSDELCAFIYALDGSFNPSDVLMGRVKKDEGLNEAPIDTIRWEGMYIYKYPGYYETLVFGASQDRSRAHRYIRAYLETEDLNFKRPVIERYKYWARNEEDSTKWQTQIIYGF